MRRKLDGVLLLDKPVGPSSSAVLPTHAPPPSESTPSIAPSSSAPSPSSSAAPPTHAPPPSESTGGLAGAMRGHRYTERV